MSDLLHYLWYSCTVLYTNNMYLIIINLCKYLSHFSEKNLYLYVCKLKLDKESSGIIPEFVVDTLKSHKRCKFFFIHNQLIIFLSSVFQIFFFSS